MTTDLSSINIQEIPSECKSVTPGNHFFLMEKGESKILVVGLYETSYACICHSSVSKFIKRNYLKQYKHKYVCLYIDKCAVFIGRETILFKIKKIACNGNFTLRN